MKEAKIRTMEGYCLSEAAKDLRLTFHQDRGVKHTATTFSLKEKAGLANRGLSIFCVSITVDLGIRKKNDKRRIICIYYMEFRLRHCMETKINQSKNVFNCFWSY